MVSQFVTVHQMTLHSNLVLADELLATMWTNKRRVRSDHSGEMIHMYSALVTQSQLPSLQLSHKGRVAAISTVC